MRVKYLLTIALVLSGCALGRRETQPHLDYVVQVINADGLTQLQIDLKFTGSERGESAFVLPSTFAAGDEGAIQANQLLK